MKTIMAGCCATVVAGSLLAVPLAAQRGRPLDASAENGRYRHGGIAFDVPANWKYEGTVTGDGAGDETAQWTDPQSGISLFAYRSQQKTAPEDIPRLVSGAVARQTQKRERQGYLEWHVRSDSVEQKSIGGHQALFAIADFERETNRSWPPGPVQAKPRLECLAWIFAPESSVLFFAALGPDQLAQFRPVFDRVVQSANLQYFL